MITLYMKTNSLLYDSYEDDSLMFVKTCSIHSSDAQVSGFRSPRTLSRGKQSSVERGGRSVPPTYGLRLEKVFF